jgi:hypothetical protein
VRLATYPHSKLQKLDEFTSPFFNNVWEFLDEIQADPQPVKHFALPEPQSSIGKDSIAHIKALLAFTGPREDRLKFELAGLRRLHAKYPNARFDAGFAEKRFKGML